MQQIKPVVAALTPSRQISSNPFGFGIVEEDTYQKKRDQKANAKAAEKPNAVEKPKVSSSKLGKKITDTSHVDPEVVEPKTQKYQKKDQR